VAPTRDDHVLIPQLIQELPIKYVPALQPAHIDAPVVEVVPGAQLMHVLELAVEYEPALQLEHDEAPADAKVPAEQFIHEMADAPENEPAEQLMQLDPSEEY
jgi:hypothetical protein